MSIEVENVFAELATPPAYRQRSPLYFAWRRFLANKAAVVGGVGPRDPDPRGDLRAALHQDRPDGAGLPHAGAGLSVG